MRNTIKFYTTIQTMLQSYMRNIHPIIKETLKKIKSIKIQGATNVAIATFETVLMWLKETQFSSVDHLYQQTYKNLLLLAKARPNEPLAVNGVRYFAYRFEQIKVEETLETHQQALKIIENILKEYLQIIAEAKKEIVKIGKRLLAPSQIVFTHCHSSTAESVIIEANEFIPKTVIVTETRPLYQGRITAKNLLKYNINTIMIVDSAAARFIADDSYLPVDVILIGADEILSEGDAINKVGSFSIGLASKLFNKPMYVVTPSLKLNTTADVNSIKIELRDPKEIWKDAPQELKIINPAFDLIPRQFISAYLTEFGLVEPQELFIKVKKKYHWITYPLKIDSI